MSEQQVAVFSGESASQVDTEVNAWLSRNPNAEIVETRILTTVVMVYREG